MALSRHKLKSTSQIIVEKDFNILEIRKYIHHEAWNIIAIHSF